MDFSTIDATTWATIWATISLVIFIGIMIYFGLPKMITKMLDARIAQIETDLAEAKRLREEAEALLVDYENKRVAAEGEAAGIVTAAQEEAKRLAEDANVALTDLIARRTKSVQDKIDQAEAQALGEVRARAADLTVEAARIVLSQQMASKGDDLVSKAIKDVGTQLN
ncbi:F-type H+-transporting ATPase subunit b [Devosia sp. UYZn731]|uniref:F0F1 ATP synthase subunit B family protein n=1 Tax=Devosia sp. UYZn731 TaxID=3156345 RepID=UPI003394CE1E